MPTYQAIPDSDGNRSPPARSYSRWLLAIILLVSTVVVSLCIFMIAGMIYPNKGDHKIVVTVIQTSHFHGDRLTQMNAVEMTNRGFDVDSLSFGNLKPCSGVDACKELEDVSKIWIDAEIKHQSILGFGGAFTEASAYNYFLLPEHVRDRIIKLYFGEDGIGYTLGRVHINSCDFSLESYSFDDVHNDFKLKFFDFQVTHDQAQMLPLMRAAIKASKRPLKILASPWSPPAWMKEADKDGKRSMVGSAEPHGLRNEPKYKDAWAKYISLFISAYHGQGVDIWAVTPQNEPEFAAPWEACSYNATGELDFISGYLGPVLEKDHPKVQLFAFDHNKDHLLAWADTILGNPESAKYVDGMAFHWYAGSMDRLKDGTFGYDTVNTTHHKYPNTLLLGSEACSCSGVRLGDWLRAERLAHDILFDLNNWANGWIDWNLLLDSLGGPNHAKNLCDAALIALPDFSDVVIQPSFYYMGHISKYVPPDSVRIYSKFVGNFRYANVDPGMREGIELGMFHCEMSTRQLWKFSSEKTLMLAKSSVDTESSDEFLVDLCVGSGDGNRDVLRLVWCRGTGMDVPLVFTLNDANQLVEAASGKCVSVVNNVNEAGGLLALSACDAAGQTWAFDSQTGVIHARTTGLCLTAGWPFLYGSAFLDHKKKTVVVVTNEAPVDTAFVLSDSRHGTFSSGINARSIQTLLFT